MDGVKGTLTDVQTGETWELAPVTIVGRASECNVVIPDQRASRRHAMIRKQEGGFWLFDLGSFNGSYLNGQRIAAARRLKDRDLLNFADFEFRYGQTGDVGESHQTTDIGGATIALIRSRSVVILVSDIEGFSLLSERLSPDDLAQIIGRWYSDCELILSRRGASVDKFIGDCVLAYWSEVNEETLNEAVRAAHELLEACQEIYRLKREVFETVDRKFRAGVAIHSGQVAYGGMSQREFTLVGEPVNLTFRLEALTRSLDADVVASAQVIEGAPALKSYAENLGNHLVKGRVEPVEVWGFKSFPK